MLNFCVIKIEHFYNLDGIVHMHIKFRSTCDQQNLLLK